MILPPKTAIAHANIALVKYWGKRDIPLNLPAVGSISLTLDALSTRTTVAFLEELPADELLLNGRPADEQPQRRVQSFMNLIRKHAGSSLFARIESSNNFPTAAGLASSASGFAALAMAATHAAGLSLDPAELTALARMGSGSAARSIYGGFVEMHRGSRSDGRDAIATQLQDEHYWPLELLILITSSEHKKTGSTRGMNLTAETSPYYQSWIESSPRDLQAMREAIAARDFTRLGIISEHSCLKMHALAMAANPGLIYWNPLTLHLLQLVRELREGGTEAYFTIDAGPQVKVLCLPKDAAVLQKQLQAVPGVERVLHSRLGTAAHLDGS